MSEMKGISPGPLLSEIGTLESLSESASEMPTARIKGLGKGGRPPSPLKGKAEGKGLPPSLSPQKKGITQPLSSRSGQTNLPLGRRLHARDLGEVPISARVEGAKPNVWEELLTARSRNSVLQDVDALKMVFSDVELHGSKPKVASQIESQSVKQKYLPQNTAMKCGILLKALPIRGEALAGLLQCLDIGKMDTERFQVDHLEQLFHVLPKPEVVQPLLDFDGPPENLRDVEREILPLVRLPRLEQRLRVLIISRSLQTKQEDLMRQCRWVQDACAELKHSPTLREILARVLVMFNFANFGVTEGHRSRIFDMSALLSLHDFKTKKGPFRNFHGLHWIVLQLLADGYQNADAEWHLRELPTLAKVAGQNLANIRGLINGLHEELDFLRNEKCNHGIEYGGTNVKSDPADSDLRPQTSKDQANSKSDSSDVQPQTVEDRANAKSSSSDSYIKPQTDEALELQQALFSPRAATTSSWACALFQTVVGGVSFFQDQMGLNLKVLPLGYPIPPARTCLSEVLRGIRSAPGYPLSPAHARLSEVLRGIRSAPDVSMRWIHKGSRICHQHFDVLSAREIERSEDQQRQQSSSSSSSSSSSPTQHVLEWYREAEGVLWRRVRRPARSALKLVDLFVRVVGDRACSSKAQPDVKSELAIPELDLTSVLPQKDQTSPSLMTSSDESDGRECSSDSEDVSPPISSRGPLHKLSPHEVDPQFRNLEQLLLRSEIAVSTLDAAFSASKDEVQHLMAFFSQRLDDGSFATLSKEGCQFFETLNSFTRLSKAAFMEVQQHRQKCLRLGRQDPVEALRQQGSLFPMFAGGRQAQDKEPTWQERLVAKKNAKKGLHLMYVRCVARAVECETDKLAVNLEASQGTATVRTLVGHVSPPPPSSGILRLGDGSCSYCGDLRTEWRLGEESKLRPVSSQEVSHRMADEEASNKDQSAVQVAELSVSTHQAHARTPTTNFNSRYKFYRAIGIDFRDFVPHSRL